MLEYDYEKRCYNTIDVCKDLLKNKEWEQRYSEYAEEIIKNKDKIQKARKSFYQVSPLYVYSRISEATKKGSVVEYDLRFCGQSVASLKIRKQEITISTKEKDKNNELFFTTSQGLGPCKLDNEKWTGPQARKFKVFFRDHEKELSERVKSPEHRLESTFLNLFNKTIPNIYPVTIADAFFQMPTPLKGSDKKNINYSGITGGGIDILARVTHGSNRDNRFAVMELKDENNPSETQGDVLLQAIKYATFLVYLLRSESGYDWYKIMNPKTKAESVPETLKIDFVSVMPEGKSDILADKKIIIEIPEKRAQLHLYSLFFDSNNGAEFSGTFSNIIKK